MPHYAYSLLKHFIIHFQIESTTLIVLTTHSTFFLPKLIYDFEILLCDT